MKNLSFILYLPAFIFLVSCKKEKDKSPDAPVIRLAKMTSNYIINPGYSVTYTYAYNSRGQLITEASVPMDPDRVESSYVDSFIYDNSERLVEIRRRQSSGINISRTTKYFYEGSSRNFYKVEYYTSDGSVTGRYLFSYADGKITVEDYDDGGPLSGRRTISITAEKNTSTIREYTDADVLIATTTFSNFALDKKSHTALLPKGYYLFESFQNPYRTYTYKEDAAADAYILNSTIEYNADGYPVKRTDEEGNYATYEYVYQ